MVKHEHSPGYLSDTTYPDRFHRELSPVWLNYVTSNGGAHPRKLDGHFTYLDLGCGFGQSAIVNAGAFPQAEFHACDFNLAHIEAAKRYTARLGIENIQFHECYFEDILEMDLPPFDFIVLHGIYSWVGSEARQTIQRIIAKKLKPGGLLYLSYNCLPGWSAEAPLRKLMLELAASQSGDTNHRARQALGMLQQLSAGSLRYFRENPTTAGAVESFTKDPANYLAHEFLNETWELYYSVDVADQMAQAGASYLGSATLPDNYPMLVIDKQVAESISKLPAARLQQLAMDFAVNQRFRRDVFVSGGLINVTQAEAVQKLNNIIIGCVGDVEQIGTQAVIPRGKISFQEDFIGELRMLMQHGSMSLGEVVSVLGGKGRNLIEITQNLIFLVAAGTLMPFAKVQKGSLKPQHIANQVVENALNYIVEKGAPGVVPSETLGNGVLVQVQEAMAIKKWLAGTEAVENLPGRLIRLGLVK